MHALLALALTVAAQAPSEAPDELPLEQPFAEVQPSAPAEPAVSTPKREKEWAGVFIGGVGSVVAISTALGSWIDQNGDFGRFCAVAGTALGVGALSFGVAFLISLLAQLDDSPKGIIEALFHGIGSFVIAALVGVIGGAVGVAGGAVIGIFASQTPGVSRGTLGVASSGVLFGLSFPLFAISLAY
ncbi:MAG: hypothetical protein QM817_00130 [Archangium sp.]